MAKKGGTRHLNRIAAPKSFSIAKKAFAWAAKPSAGPHAAKEAVSLLSVLRDSLGVAADAREAARAINQGRVLVDGRAVKNERFPVGLMDVVSIPALKAHYRACIDSKERIVFRELSEQQAGFKYCKVLGKTTAKGGRTLLRLHDGRSLAFDKPVKVGDTLRLELDGKKQASALPLKEDALCLIIKGKHAGKLARLKSVIPGTATREAQAVLEGDGREFITVLKYLFAVDEDFGGKA
ncbi:MAG: 30S ribosomal protein S4e [Candidatus Micrarchaeia archaeon]